MTALMQFAEGAFVLAGGLVVRLMVALLFLAAIVLPILLVLEAWTRLAPLRARLLGPSLVGGMSWREDVYYAPGHTWLKRGWRKRFKVGVDGLVQRLVSDACRVELPAVGERVRRGEVAARIRCGEREAAIVSAVDGTVSRVNEALARDPARVAKDPYGGGWLYAVEPSGSDYRRLPFGEAAREWFRSEGVRFDRMLESGLGLAAADGGVLVGPAPQLVDRERWKALTDRFLSAA
jgi:glycine cleavage system H lipoate-binding protein